MNTTRAEQNEAQDQEPKNRYSIAGASPMKKPDKTSLAKHAARNLYHVETAAEMLCRERDRLQDHITQAVSTGDEEKFRELSGTVQVVKRVLAHLRASVPPSQWANDLPAVIVKDPMEDDP